MAAVEEKSVEKKIIKDVPILKEIELKNIGFLRDESTFVNCPACESEGLSVVRLEVVTCLQRFLKAIKCCQKWNGRHDINHYCSKCGCYIGRHVPIGCMERCVSRQARKKAAHDAMVLKTKPKDCAQEAQKRRDNVKAQRKAEKEAKEQAANEQEAAANQTEEIKDNEGK